MLRNSPLLPEKFPQAITAFLAQNATYDFDSMVMGRVAQEVQCTAGGAGLRIVGAEDNA